jgi:hypothetical protein
MHKPIVKHLRNEERRHVKLIFDGDPLMKKWLKFFGRNIIRGEIKSPAALTDVAAVIK